MFDASIPPPKEEPAFFKHFKASKLPAHREIIRVLKENPPNTISVLALGPMTNVAMAAAEDPEAMLRMKELLVMGGTIDSPGNASPVAEFNTFYDPMACARSFALSSPDPNSTMPPSNNSGRYFDAYPENLPEALKVKLFPLDITLTNCVDYKNFTEKIQGQLDSKGPLATMVNTYFDGLHKKDPSNACVVQHDPLPLWYALTSENAPWDMSSPKDIRVETSGQWTTGMDVVDRRATPRANGINETEVSEDPLGWLSSVRGNRIVQALKSPGAAEFNERFLMLFGL